MGGHVAPWRGSYDRDYPHAQLRENVEFVMDGLEAAAQAARNPSGSNIQVAYSLPPEGGSGFGDLVYATVPLGLRGDQGRPGLARQRALRAVPVRQN